MRWNLPRFSLTSAVIFLGVWGGHELWSKVIEPARSAARRTKWANNLIQHSGFHSDSVVIGTDGKVLRVSCCPVCGGDAFRTFYQNEKGVPLNEADLPLLTFLEAQRSLSVQKSSSRYRELRERSSSSFRDSHRIKNSDEP